MIWVSDNSPGIIMTSYFERRLPARMSLSRMLV